jgi:excisionase family DNA binding protein
MPIETHASTSDNDPWLTLQEAAERARCHESTLRRLIRARKLRHARIGGTRIRLRTSWLDAALEAAATPQEAR